MQTGCLFESKLWTGWMFIRRSVWFHKSTNPVRRLGVSQTLSYIHCWSRLWSVRVLSIHLFSSISRCRIMLIHLCIAAGGGIQLWLQMFVVNWKLSVHAHSVHYSLIYFTISICEFNIKTLARYTRHCKDISIFYVENIVAVVKRSCCLYGR